MTTMLQHPVHQARLLDSAACPLCGEKNAREDADEALKQCPGCHTRFRWPRDLLEESEYWSGYADAPIEQSYDVLRTNFYRAFWRLIRGLPEGTSDRGTSPHLLDIGCVPGKLLQQAKADGWSVTGIELSETLCEVTRRQVEAPIYQGRFEESALPDQMFDLVVASDVLRHASDPLSILQRARKVLRPGGVLVIRDLNPLHRRLARRIARPYPCDMQMIPIRALCSALKKAGFSEMTCQSSPVSLLTVPHIRRLAARAPAVYAGLIGMVNGALRLWDRSIAHTSGIPTASYLVIGRKRVTLP